jgi:hypothetical protein
MSVEVNGLSVHAPLLELPDFEEALKSGGTLVYEREGLRVEVDLANRKWSANIESGALAICKPR